MKVTEATDEPNGEGNVLYYDIRTDNGTPIGTSYKNINPFKGDTKMTMEDAKKNAMLWAAAPDLLEALEAACNFIEVFSAKHKGYLGKDWQDAMAAGVNQMKSAIYKALGL